MDRPADAGEVARAVAALRAAADERARQAELDRAKAEVQAEPKAETKSEAKAPETKAETKPDANAAATTPTTPAKPPETAPAGRWASPMPAATSRFSRRRPMSIPANGARWLPV